MEKTIYEEVVGIRELLKVQNKNIISLQEALIAVTTVIKLQKQCNDYKVLCLKEEIKSLKNKI